jgi:hypothetical protein
MIIITTIIIIINININIIINIGTIELARGGTAVLGDVDERAGRYR